MINRLRDRADYVSRYGEAKPLGAMPIAFQHHSVWLPSRSGRGFNAHCEMAAKLEHEVDPRWPLGDDNARPLNGADDGAKETP